MRGGLVIEWIGDGRGWGETNHGDDVVGCMIVGGVYVYIWVCVLLS